MTVANSALRGTMHILLLLAKRGLLSPQDAEEICENNILKELADLPQEVQGTLDTSILVLCAEIKRIAAAKWDGK